MPAKDVTITGTFAVIMTPPTGKSGLVYNGAALDLITAGSSIIGTMQYSLDGTTYATTIPQGTDAGSYTVYYRVKGDGNYSDIAAQSLDVTIASKTVENMDACIKAGLNGLTMPRRYGGLNVPMTVYSAANEIVNLAFRQGRCSFLQMAEIIQKTLEHVSHIKAPTLEDYLECDAEARNVAKELIF